MQQSGIRAMHLEERLPNQNELNHGDLPVARMTGANRFLGMGLHFYFQPRRTYDLFPFVEEREKPGDKYFKTSFRLYLMPVIPASAKTLADLDKSKSTDHEVVVIEWSHLRKDNEKSPEKCMRTTTGHRTCARLLRRI